MGNITSDRYPIAILGQSAQHRIVIKTSWTTVYINLASTDSVYNIWWIEVPRYDIASFVDISITGPQTNCNFSTTIGISRRKEELHVKSFTFMFSSNANRAKNLVLSEWTFSGRLAGEMSLKFDASWEHGDCQSITKYPISKWGEIIGMFESSGMWESFTYTRSLSDQPCSEFGYYMSLKIEYAEGFTKNLRYNAYTTGCKVIQSAIPTPAVPIMMDTIGDAICRYINKKSPEECLISTGTSKRQFVLPQDKCPAMEGRSTSVAKNGFIGVFSVGIVITIIIIGILLIGALVIYTRREHNSKVKTDTFLLLDENDDEDELKYDELRDTSNN